MFPLTKWHAAWITGIACLTALVAWPALRNRRPAPAGPIQVTSSPPRPATPPSERTAALPGPIYVHVSGRVAKPGLYRLAAGSRVMDAVSGAGGATADADLDALNLATPLRDGQKLVVPGFGEPPPQPVEGYLVDTPPEPDAVMVRPDPVAAAAPEPGPAPETAPAWSSPTPPAEAAPSPRAAPSAKLRQPGDGVVNINGAGAAELQRLPGVGPATAARILEYRQANGGFKTVEELMEVKGIGEKKLAKMRPFVVLE